MPLFGGKIHNLFQLLVQPFEEGVELFVGAVGGQQMGGDDDLAVFRAHGDVAGHVGDGGGGDFQHLPGHRQIAELQGVIVGEGDVVALADHAADVVVAGDAEIVFGDRQFQLRQHVVVGFAGFSFVPSRRRFGLLSGAGRQ